MTTDNDGRLMTNNEGRRTKGNLCDCQVCRLEVGDTAGWKPALQLYQEKGLS